MLRMTVATDSIAIPGGPTLPAQDADLRTAALGPRVQYDSRDNPFYPRRGMQVQGVASFYDESVGGNRTYQAYQGWINSYTARRRASRVRVARRCVRRRRIGPVLRPVHAGQESGSSWLQPSGNTAIAR